MAPNPFFSGRIPKDLHDRIEAYLAETNESKTQLLINSLAAYLNYPIQQNNSLSNAIEERITELERKVEAIEQLERDISEIKQSVITKSILPDIKFDNKFDNDTSPGQLSLLKRSNSLDNKTDIENDNKEDIDNNSDNKTDIENEEWNDLGEMHIPEILQIEELQQIDRNKLKQKLRNANHYKNKTAIIEPYQLRIVGKEAGSKGQLVYRVYKRKS